MSDNLINPNQIYNHIQERYGALAEQGDSCCGDSQNVQLYETDLVSDLPSEVLSLSLGCGDPVTIASLEAGETVLDLGSGGGIDCFMAAKQVGESGHVIGVDMTPAMIEKANANKARMKMNQVEFRFGQIEALPVEDDSIDVVMSNCVLNLVPDKALAFAEIFRVLKPGGRMAVSDIVTEGHVSDELRADLSKWSECVTGAIDVTVYIDLLKAAGFSDVKVVDKVDAAEKGIPERDDMPPVYSARITAQKSR